MLGHEARSMDQAAIDFSVLIEFDPPQALGRHFVDFGKSGGCLSPGSR